ncbi:3-beta-hydroxysteroid sulfotransferase-like [Dermacentor andersoni]|uniref:3-beta-hydroxysteroid sulfotransferase-like n=1 Tax=Dermacentor andersoni TaxID=34620 RepID=UPI002416FD42|nr:3-beta-hydroxysteroid sulfotransferase-like [Dermacentor andersoni]
MTTHDEFSEEWRFVEYMDIKDWTSSLPLRTFATHLAPDKTNMTDEGKYIYVTRNPWDVCVSFYHMTSNLSIFDFQYGTFEEFVSTFLNGNFGYGDYFEHVASGYALREQPNVLFVTYEELKNNTREIVLKLAYFLGEKYGRVLHNDEMLLQQLLQRSQPDYMRSVVVLNLSGSANPQWDEFITQRKATCKEQYEGDENRYALVRTAKVGGWKEHFTPDLLHQMKKRIFETEKKSSFMDLWKDIRAEAINCFESFE